MERQPNIGSLNWNAHAARENREVVVALEGRAVARYYREVFRADWRGGGRGRLPVGILVAVALAALLALLIARRVTAGGGGRDDPAGGW